MINPKSTPAGSSFIEQLQASEVPVQDAEVEVHPGLAVKRKSTTAWEERHQLAQGVHEMLQGPFTSLEELEKTGSEALTRLSKW